MAQTRRVAITGMGAICGLGHDLKQVWGGVLEGRSGVSQAPSLETTDIPVKIAGVVKDFTIAEQLLSAKDAGKYDRFIHFAIHATADALKSAGMMEGAETRFPYPAHRVGCLLGVGMGGFPFI